MNEHPVSTFVSLSRSQAHAFEQLSDEEFWHYATEAARPVSTLQRHADEYLVCRPGTRYCMFPLAPLGEIVPAPHQLTLLPAVPSWMLGMTTWRSKIIAIIDLDAYLWSDGKHGTGITDAGHIHRPQSDLLLVVQARDVTLGLMVRAVDTTVHFDVKHMVPFELAPGWCAGLRPGAVRGLLDDVLVLDISAIFDDIVRQIKEQSLA